MAGPTTFSDFEDLVPPGVDSPGDWLRALAERLVSAPTTEKQIGGVQVSAPDVEAAKVALFDWANGIPETDPRKQALRRDFLHWLLRPALRIKRVADGVVPDDVAPPVWGPHADAIRRIVRTHGPSVARLDAERGGVREHLGTAWVVGSAGNDWVLLTALHVVRQANARGWSDGTARVVLDFDCLDGPSPAVLVATAGELHPSLDVATLRLARAGAPDLAPLPLDDGGPDPIPDHPALVLGYPAFLRQDVGVFATKTLGFDGVTSVKRAAPGRLRAAPQPVTVPPIDGKPRWQPAFAHDATTLGGNSGSPVFSLVTGKVVGLHVGGKPTHGPASWFVDNYALPAWTLTADGILKALKNVGPG
jgi:hypothetical protein